MKDNKDFCPHCKADLQGASIPLESQHLFGATHYSRRIGLYDSTLDLTTKYMCPDCAGTWIRRLRKDDSL